MKNELVTWQRVNLKLSYASGQEIWSFYGTLRSITIFEIFRHLTLSWISSIYFAVLPWERTVSYNTIYSVTLQHNTFSEVIYSDYSYFFTNCHHFHNKEFWYINTVFLN